MKNKKLTAKQIKKARSIIKKMPPSPKYPMPILPDKDDMQYGGGDCGCGAGADCR